MVAGAGAKATSGSRVSAVGAGASTSARGRAVAAGSRVAASGVSTVAGTSASRAGTAVGARVGLGAGVGVVAASGSRVRLTSLCWSQLVQVWRTKNEGRLTTLAVDARVELVHELRVMRTVVGGGLRRGRRMLLLRGVLLVMAGDGVLDLVDDSRHDGGWGIEVMIWNKLGFSGKSWAR